MLAGSTGRAVQSVGLLPLSCWDCRFEFRQGHWTPVYSECCVYCPVQVSASGCSLVQRSPTESGMSECDSEVSIKRRPLPTRVSYCYWKK
jgi:hypothetical protein